MAGEQQVQQQQQQRPPPEDIWRRRLRRWLLTRATPIEPPIGLGDITDVISGKFPAASLRADLQAMTIAEWSRLARDGFANSGAATPHWVFAAALRALGFSQRVILETGESELAADAPSDRPGILHQFTPGAESEFAEPPNPAEPPKFSFPQSDRDTYVQIIAWLFNHDALSVVTTPRQEVP